MAVTVLSATAGHAGTTSNHIGSRSMSQSATPNVMAVSSVVQAPKTTRRDAQSTSKILMLRFSSITSIKKYCRDYPPGAGDEVIFSTSKCARNTFHLYHIRPDHQHIPLRARLVQWYQRHHRRHSSPPPLKPFE